MGLRCNVFHDRCERGTGAIKGHSRDAILLSREAAQVPLRHVVVKLRCVTVPHARMLSDCTDMLANADRFRTTASTPVWVPRGEREPP